MSRDRWDVKYETTRHSRPLGSFGKLIMLIILAPFAYVAATLFFGKIKLSGLFEALSTFLP
jgi:hypothetical protein